MGINVKNIEFDIPKLIAISAIAYSFSIALINISFFQKIGFEYIYLFGIQDLLFSGIIIFRLIYGFILVVLAFGCLMLFFNVGRYFFRKFIYIVRQKFIDSHGLKRTKIVAYIDYWTPKLSFMSSNVFLVCLLLLVLILIKPYFSDEWIISHIIIGLALACCNMYLMLSDNEFISHRSPIHYIWPAILLVVAIGGIGHSWAKGILAGGEPTRFIRDDTGECLPRHMVRSNSTGVLVYDRSEDQLEFRTWRTIKNITDRPCWKDYPSNQYSV